MDFINDSYQITQEGKCSLQQVQLLQGADNITMMLHPVCVQEQHGTQTL